jgi:O-antigen ligase
VANVSTSYGPPRAARFSSGLAAEALSTRTLTAIGVAAILVVGGIAGGGRGGLGDTAAQVLALVLFAWLSWLGLADRLVWRAPAWVRWLPALAFALPLFQLLPAPEWLWTLGKGRALLASQLAAAGVSLPHRISLDPFATETALWSLLPASALFLAVLTLRRGTQVFLLALLMLLALGNVFLGMGQVSGGVDSPLRLYEHTNLDQAVGFFANRNHFASLLVMCLPLALALTASAAASRLEGRSISPLRVLLGCTLVVILIVGIALSRSRAGVLLGMLAVLGSLPIVTSLGPQKGARRLLALAMAVAALFVVQFSLIGVVHRIDVASLDDGRLRYTTLTLEAARDYAPLGSGLGTFRNAYQPYEIRDGNPGRYIVNHAHDDYAELLLEGGVLALVLLAVGLSAWGRQGWRAFRAKSRDGNGAAAGSILLTRACWWGATLGLLHSAMDYPLRTTAAMCAFALLAAVAFSNCKMAGGERRAGP